MPEVRFAIVDCATEKAKLLRAAIPNSDSEVLKDCFRKFDRFGNGLHFVQASVAVAVCAGALQHGKREDVSDDCPVQGR